MMLRIFPFFAQFVLVPHDKFHCYLDAINEVYIGKHCKNGFNFFWSFYFYFMNHFSVRLGSVIMSVWAYGSNNFYPRFTLDYSKTPPYRLFLLGIFLGFSICLGPSPHSFWTKSSPQLLNGYFINPFENNFGC